jgi:hypothetical protein
MKVIHILNRKERNVFRKERNVFIYRQNFAPFAKNFAFFALKNNTVAVNGKYYRRVSRNIDYNEKNVTLSKKFLFSGEKMSCNCRKIDEKTEIKRCLIR